MLSLPNKKIYVAGHNGLVGGALVRRLQAENCEILTAPRTQLDLRDQAAVNSFFKSEKPDIVIMAAATVGGIGANIARPAEFIYDNLAMETHVIHAACKAGVEKLLFLGSSCIYPRNAAQPMAADALLSGPLEGSNEFYAVAKIAGIKMCEAYQRQYGARFISAMPCNLYGPGDRYDMRDSHVIPALLMKMHAAQAENAAQVTLWGTGRPLREFLYVDDLADALVYLLRHYEGPQPVNIGSGQEITIATLATAIAETVGYRGSIKFDPAHPDGVMRKIMDSRPLHDLGWDGPYTDLATGLRAAYDDYRQRVAKAA